MICLFPSPTLAQTLPDAPKPKPHSQKVFWIGTALLAASQTADAITTRKLLDRGGVELDPIFGRNPSPGKQAGINAALFVGQVLAFRLTERNRHAWIRWVGRAAIGYQVSDYARAAACNSGLNPHSSQGCRP